MKFWLSSMDSPGFDEVFWRKVGNCMAEAWSNFTWSPEITVSRTRSPQFSHNKVKFVMKVLDLWWSNIICFLHEYPRNGRYFASFSQLEQGFSFLTWVCLTCTILGIGVVDGSFLFNTIGILFWLARFVRRFCLEFLTAGSLMVPLVMGKYLGTWPTGRCLDPAPGLVIDTVFLIFVLELFTGLIWLGKDWEMFTGFLIKGIIDFGNCLVEDFKKGMVVVLGFDEKFWPEDIWS